MGVHCCVGRSEAGQLPPLWTVEVHCRKGSSENDPVSRVRSMKFTTVKAAQKDTYKQDKDEQVDYRAGYSETTVSGEPATSRLPPWSSKALTIGSA